MIDHVVDYSVIILLIDLVVKERDGTCLHDSNRTFEIRALTMAQTRMFKIRALAMDGYSQGWQEGTIVMDGKVSCIYTSFG